MILFLLLFLSSFAYAETPANLYLVWGSSITSLNLTSMKGMEFDNSFQSVKKFNVINLPNTNYYLVTVTTNTNIQNSILDSFGNSGRVRRIRAYWGVDGVYDGSKGGVIYNTRVEQFNSIPDDAYRKWSETWEVIRSS